MEQDKQYKISCNFIECNNIGTKRYLGPGTLFDQGVLMVLCDEHMDYIHKQKVNKE